jgi:Fe-S cluster assembly protein SufD
MLVESSKEEQTFTHHMKEMLKLTEMSGLLGNLRSKSWDAFQKLGLPTRKTDCYRRIRMHKFLGKEYSTDTSHVPNELSITSHILPECQNSVIVILDGQYKPELSRIDDLHVLALKDAMKTYGAFITKRWSEDLKLESDPFVLMNAALHGEGIFIYLPPKKRVENPIQVLHIITESDSPRILMPRIECCLSAHSQMIILSTTVTPSRSFQWVNGVFNFSLDDGSRAELVQVGQSKPSEQEAFFEAVRVTQKKHSFFKSVNVSKGSLTSRYDYRVALAGIESEVQLNALWTLKDKLETHHNIFINHQQPHCRSMQFFKGALDGQSRSNFEGKIVVDQKAQKTDAFQLNRNLLLSDGAHADSQPNLEIFADDVKASHGATFGQLELDEVFYLRSRGFSEADAKAILTYAYCKEVIDRIPVESVKQRLSHDLENS